MDLRYVIVDRLGSGSFAHVLKVKSSLTDTFYALKVARNEGREILRNEAKLHSRLTHPNIIQFVSAFESLNCSQVEGVIPLSKGKEGKCTAMVVEFCQFGTLQTKIMTELPTMGQLQNWAVEIASGLFYLKEQGIIHRDIKPDNILLCGDTIKIGDFGLAKYAEDLEGTMGSITKRSGTPFYMPFEAFSNIYSYATDVFAFGVVLYMMYTGHRPFNAKNESQLKTALKANDVKFVFDKRLETDRDQSLEELLLRMLAFDSKLRPSIEEIVKHPFFHVEELDTTVSIDGENDDDDLPMSMIEFRNHKAEFGDGTREQFYVYLANLHPFMTPMTMHFFTLMWNNL